MYTVSGDNMDPTLPPGSTITVRGGVPVTRGDIIVFGRPPSEASDPTIAFLVGRVIGLPGETIEAREGRVYINGVQLDEPYLNADSGVTTSLPVTVVPTDDYFVLGDNRINSKDSRFIGPIPMSLIVGVAVR